LKDPYEILNLFSLEENIEKNYERMGEIENKITDQIDPSYRKKVNIGDVVPVTSKIEKQKEIKRRTIQLIKLR
jgi:hypothetical protein